MRSSALGVRSVTVDVVGRLVHTVAPVACRRRQVSGSHHPRHPGGGEQAVKQQNIGRLCRAEDGKWREYITEMRPRVGRPVSCPFSAPRAQVFRRGSEIRFCKGYQFVSALQSSHLPLHNTSFTMALALGSRQIGRVGAKAPARSVRANAASRPLWRPGSTPPAHLKGE